jgi:hypothetical protein
VSTIFRAKRSAISTTLAEDRMRILVNLGVEIDEGGNVRLFVLERMNIATRGRFDELLVEALPAQRVLLKPLRACLGPLRQPRRQPRSVHQSPHPEASQERWRPFHPLATPPINATEWQEERDLAAERS